MQTKSLLVAFALTLPLTAQDDAHKGWHADFDVAMKAAKESGKDLLVDFTGSDWCPPCKALTATVLSNEEFMAKAGAKFELLALDFPNSAEAKAKVPNSERNDELSKQYEITSFPTVMLITTDGLVYGRWSGYGGESVEAYLEKLDQKIAGKANLIEAEGFSKKFEAAEDDAKLEMLPKLMTLLDGATGEDPIASLLGGPLEAALDSGLLKKADKELDGVKTLLAIGRMSDKIEAAVARLDPKNENGLREQLLQGVFSQVRDDESARAALTALDEVLTLGFKDKEQQKQWLMTGAGWCAEERLLNDLPRAKKYAEMLKPLAGDDEGLKKMIEDILSR